MPAQLILPSQIPDWHGRSVLITGGAAGIGRCLTLCYALAGATVVVADWSEPAGQETLGILREYQVQATFLCVDVSDPDSREKLVAETLKVTSGRLDALINNAGIADAHAAHLFSDDPTAFERVLAVNLAAPFHLSRLLIPALQQTSGSIIHVASTRAFSSEPRSEGYAASKGGLVALTHAMAISLSDQHIRVNAIAPGWIDTTAWQLGRPEPTVWEPDDHRQHPAGRIGQPADIAALSLFLTGPDAGFITGETWVVDGGMTRKMIYR